MLDGQRHASRGIDVDTDLRWLIVGQLAEEGKADVALIQATMAVGSLATSDAVAAPRAWPRGPPRPPRRRRGSASPIRAPRCPPPGRARPTASSRWHRWPRSFAGFYIGSVGVGGMMAHGPDPELLRPYVTRYLDALPAVWAERTIDEAEMFTECLYPSHLVDDSVVMAVDLASRAVSSPARRCGSSAKDATARCALSGRGRSTRQQERRSPLTAAGGRVPSSRGPREVSQTGASPCLMGYR